MILETLRLILRLFREEDVAEPANGGQLLHKSAAISLEHKTVFKGFPALVFTISRERWLMNRAA